MATRPKEAGYDPTMEVAGLILGGLALGFGAWRLVVALKAKKHAKDAADAGERQATAAEELAATERDRRDREAEARRLNNRPFVYGHKAKITGSGNVQVELRTETPDKPTSNIDVVLYQDGREIGRKEGIPTLADDVPREHDMSPAGSHGFQPKGVSYKVVCDFNSPDGHRWRSTYVSGIDYQHSGIESFELLS